MPILIRLIYGLLLDFRPDYLSVTKVSLAGLIYLL
ncbi:MAG TPA: hypothetical protein [Caudoviricetes sp.]|nr:MAG TPA: hypothetical protein [Caudoviricetes sp.]